MCSRVSRLNSNTRESSFKALANVFEGLDFLSPKYCDRKKLLVATSATASPFNQSGSHQCTRAIWKLILPTPVH